MRTSSVILGITAGAAVGAILGLLLAPDSGVNTRQRISDQGHKLVDHLKAGYQSLVNGELEPNPADSPVKRKVKETVRDVMGS